MVEEKTKRDWWEKGKGIDLWSIPHFLFGVLMGIFPFLLGISLQHALALLVALAVLWEIYEKLIGIRESSQNIAFDIVLPVLAFIFTSQMLLAYPLHPHDLLVVETAVFIIYMYTNISGLLAYRRRKRGFMS